jgi:nicotinamide-nucleotide amidase
MSAQTSGGGSGSAGAPDFSELVRLAEGVAVLLKARGQRIAVAESSTGGLLSAALLAVPGASAYFLGGAVVYTTRARRLLADLPNEAVEGMRSASQPYALLLARHTRTRFRADWGLSETGATGPEGNRYGDAAGHSCIALAGPVEHCITLETGSADRVGNMHTFTAAALGVLARALAADGAPAV